MSLSASSDSAPPTGFTLDDIRSWPATVDLGTASRAIGFSQAHGYNMLRAGKFPAKVVRVGGRVRVVTASLVRLLSDEGVEG